MQDKTTAIVIGCALLAGVMLLLLVWFRGGVPSPGPVEPDASGRAEAPRPPPTPITPPEAAGDDTPTPESTDADGSTDAAAEEPVPKPGRVILPGMPAIDETWEFTEGDLTEADRRDVEIDLGDYTVVPGEEFEVAVYLDAPPLQSFLLAMTYDMAMLRVVPESAKAVGGVFRAGIEFFEHPAGGRMAIMCATVPGQKNILAANDEQVAAFRMRALKAGETTIGIDTKGLNFDNGRGQREAHEIVGGKVVIE